jgi:thiosulfate/3-mercaptopyruvate sulfurtransferase
MIGRGVVVRLASLAPPNVSWHGHARRLAGRAPYDPRREAAMTIALPSAVVDGDWLGRHLDEVVPVDVRWYLDGRSGLAAYEREHIAGAVFLDIDRDLAAPPAPGTGRHPLPSPERFAATMSRAGVAPGDVVVAYDDAGGATAARLWWMLDSIGQPCAVLDGGIVAWRGPIATRAESRPPVPRTAVPWPADRFVDADDVQRRLGDASGVVLDARSPQRFAHGDASIDPRPGHIPGARNSFWQHNLDPDSWRFLSAGSLAAHFESLGVSSGDTVVAYCGSGVTACHDLLALRLAGITDLALYTGSWSEWGADRSRPAETGDAPA